MTTTCTKPEAVVHPTRPSRFTLVAVFVVVLAVALGFGAGFVVRDLTQDEPTGLANDATVSLIEDYGAASNAGDVFTGEPVQQGNLVTTTYSESGSHGVVTFEISDGRISHVWWLVDAVLGPAA